MEELEERDENVVILSGEWEESEAGADLQETLIVPGIKILCFP